MRVFPKSRYRNGSGCNRDQSFLMALPGRVRPRGDTLGKGGGENYLYAITIHQEQENSLDVVTCIIKVFTFDVYTFLDPGSIVSFKTPHVAIEFLYPN